MPLTAYVPTVWINNQQPARNETNLNKQEQGIKAVTDEAINHASRIADLEDEDVTMYDTIASLEWGFKNFFANGNFELNQRGNASYTTAGVAIYTLDRFKTGVSTGQIVTTTTKSDGRKALRTYKNTASDTYQLVEQLLPLMEYMKGDTVTISGKVKFNVSSPDSYLAYGWVDGTQGSATWLSLNVDNTNIVDEQSFSITITLPTDATDYSYFAVSFMGNAATGTTDYDFELSKIQFEFGSVATLYENRLDELELLFCGFPADNTLGYTPVYDANVAKFNVPNTWSETQTFEGITETVTSKAASFTPNLDTEGTIFKVTAAATITMPTAVAGKSFVVLDTGAFISGWGASPAIRWKDGALPTYTSIAYFVFSCVDGTNWDGQMIGGDYATV